MDVFQRVTKDTGYAFVVAENLLQENLFPSILFGKYKSLPPIVLTLIKTLFNKSGLGLQDPVASENDKCIGSLRASCELIGAVTLEI